jgi:hypothetical protein
MNKNILFLLIALGLASTTSAQITLGTNDFSHAGDTFRVSNANPYTGLIPATTGANMTWDFLQLNDHFRDQTIDTFLSVSTLPSLISLYYSFYKPCNQATFTSTSFLNTLGIPINGTYDMFNNGSTNFRERGIGILSDTIAAPIGYSTDDIIYKFPLQYGNMDTSSFGYSVSQIPGIYYSTSKTRFNSVDGWGTLISPYGTFNVLRVASIIHEHDSINLDTLGTGVGFDQPEVIEYKWLGAGKGIPLLQINTTGGIPTQIVYRDSVRIAIGIAELSGNSGFSFDVFPNPVSNSIHVRYSLAEAAEVSFEIFNALGIKVYSEKSSMQSPGGHIQIIERGDQLARGYYFLRASVGGKYFARPLVVSK